MATDLFTASDAASLPQSVISLKSENGLTFNSSTTGQVFCDFIIPATLGYMVSEETTFSFDFTYVTDDGVVYGCRPQKAGGIGSIIHQVDCYSHQDGVHLETIQDYEVINNCLMSHNNGADKELQDGYFNQLSMTECYTMDDQDVIPFKTPNVLPSSPTTPITAQAYQTQKIELKLRNSYLLGGDKVVPLSAIGGIRLRLTLNNIEIFTILDGREIDDQAQVFAPGAATATPFVVDANNQDLAIAQSGTGGYLITTANNTIVGPDSTETIPVGYYPDQTIFLAVVQAKLDLAFVPATTSLQLTAGAGINDWIITILVADCVVGGADTFLSGTNFFATGTQGTYDLASSPFALTTLAPIGVNSAQIATGNYNAADLQTATNTAFDTLCGAGNLTCTAAAGAGTAYTTSFTNTMGGAVELNVAGSALVPVDSYGLYDLGDAAANPGTPIIAGADPTGVPLMPYAIGNAKDYLEFINNYYTMNPTNFNTCPFVIGQKLQVGNGGGSTASKESPAISDISVNADSGLLQVEFATAWVMNQPYVAGDQFKTSATALATSNLQFRLTNVALNIPIITPPPSYVKKIVAAMTSEEGMRVDMKVWNLVRSNIQPGQTLSAMNLPFNNTSRAKSLLAIPVVVSRGSFAERYCANQFNNLRLTKYYYMYYGKKHPELAIDTDRARQGSLSQELIVEQTKSFEYALDKVQDLSGWSDRYLTKTFFVGRNLSLFNSTCDLRNANVSCVLESTSSDGGVIAQTNVDHFCRCINSLVCRTSGVVLVQ